jgi:Na+-translocating ferredoxin:NAD+ oxidoreductase RnfE subunit
MSFRRFFRVGLRLPMYRMIAKVLRKFEICMHQITPNDIVGLGVFICVGDHN